MRLLEHESPASGGLVSVAFTRLTGKDISAIGCKITLLSMCSGYLVTESLRDTSC